VLGILESGYKTRTLGLSAIAIASVVLVEVAIGLAANSLAIVSDGLHALLDVVTTLVFFWAVREAAKPPDEEHMYGHEKFESIGGFVGGLALAAVALLLIVEAVLKIVHGQGINSKLEYAGFIALGYTFCVDLFRVRTFLKVRKSESSTMKVAFYHSVADMSSTAIAFLGFGLATLGFNYADSISSMILGGLLTYLSVRLVWNGVMELTDSISKDVADMVRHEIVGTQGVCRLDALKIRKVAEKTFVNAIIEVPDYLDFEESHSLTTRIESDLKKQFGDCEVMIHAEPCRQEMPTEKLVEKLASEVEGVKEAHEVSTAHIDGKLYVTLHANVDPKLSVEAAHQIAQQIETRIEERIPEVEDVAVHIEPYQPRIQKGSTVKDEEIRKAVHNVLESYGQAVRVNGIVTYVSRKRLYINIDCMFVKHIPIEDAHQIASNIEQKLEEQFAETAVTVHMEPS
jgi:cation diffusion facilitator family transporter